MENETRPADSSVEPCWLLGYATRLSVALADQPDNASIRDRLLTILLECQHRYPDWQSLPRHLAQYGSGSLWQSLECKRVIIVTDGEPDDLIALLLLQRLGRLENASIIVSGWEDPEAKADHVRGVLGLGRNVVFIGEPSDQAFCYSERRRNTTYAKWHPDLFKQALIVSLAPPLELSQVEPRLLTASNLAIYGGFNLRGFDRGMLTNFGRTILYEGPSPAVHDMTLIELLPRGIQESITRWNAHALSYGGQIAESIAQCPMQFVNADTGLIATLIGGHLVTDYQLKLVDGCEQVLRGDQLFQQQLDWMKRVLA